MSNYWIINELKIHCFFFAVECSDGSKVSDTEELLGGLGSQDDINERLRTTCTTPPLQSQDNTVPPSPLPPSAPNENSSTPKKQIPEHHLNFEVIYLMAFIPKLMFWSVILWLKVKKAYLEFCKNGVFSVTPTTFFSLYIPTKSMDVDFFPIHV